MENTNHVVEIGRLTTDGNLTYAGDGFAILNFSIAVNHMKKKDGTSDVSYFQCKAFGKLAENLGKYLTKGKQVSITGFLKQERWEKDGQKQSRVIINCEKIEMLGGSNNGGQNNGYNGGYNEEEIVY